MRSISRSVLIVAAFLPAMLPAPPIVGQEAAAWREDLETIPEIDLEGFEPSVARQLEEMRGLLGTILAHEQASPGEVGRAFGQVGRVFHTYGLLDPAAACYRNARRLVAGDVRWVFYLGHVHEAAGRLDAAAASYREALEIAPMRVGTLIRLAKVELARNQPDVAEGALQRALELEPDAAAAMAALGELEMSRRNYRQAVDWLEAALELVPSADRLHYPLALAYRQLGEVAVAREHLQARGSVGLRYPDPLLEELTELLRGETVHLLRGRMAYRAGRYEDAAAEFHKAVEARPESARARTNLGSALAGLGDTDAAVAQFRAALELDPENAAGRFNLGALLARRGDDAGAAEQFRVAARLEPDDSEAHRELADALRRLGHLDAASEQYDEALQIDPRDESARFGKADTIVREGRYREARRFLEEALELHPGSLVLSAALARLLAACPDTSVRNGTRALELARGLFATTGQADHAEILAMALAEEGRCTEAASWQERVVQTTRRAGAMDDLDRLEAVLERYRQGPPCGAPAEPVDGR